jgi:hypothetical protein
MSTRKRVIGSFRARLGGGEQTVWKYRRITTVELIRLETDLRSYREKTILMSLGVVKANQALAAGNAGAELDAQSASDLTAWRDHMPSEEDVMPLFEWLVELIVDVEGLEPTWAELDEEARLEAVELFGPDKANDILAHITERSGLTEIDLGNSSAGSPSSTAPAPQAADDKSPSYQGS